MTMREVTAMREKAEAERIGRAILADAYWVVTALIDAKYQFRKEKYGTHGDASLPTPYDPVLAAIGTRIGSSNSWPQRITPAAQQAMEAKKAEEETK